MEVFTNNMNNMANNRAKPLQVLRSADIFSLIIFYLSEKYMYYLCKRQICHIVAMFVIVHLKQNFPPNM
jgi:hypothetical protein